MRKLLMTAVIAATAATSFAAGAFAQSPEDVAKSRRAYYSLVGFEMGVLGGMARGKMDYDAEKAAAAAKDLMTLASLNLADYFAAGTSNEDLPGMTRAKPEIWADFPAFGEKGKAYYEAVVALNEVAGDGLEALQPAVGALGGTCAACHKEFRAKDF